MFRLSRFFCFVILFFLLIASGVSAATYYVSTSGSDSNSGTSESSPWAHLPGMATWTGNYSPVAGDSFILRGCDVWTNSSFPITWKWSGASGNPITVGVDQTWYNTTNCPSSWNRPVFNAGGTAIQPPECSGGNSNKFLVFNSATYVTFNSIELTGLYWNSVDAIIVDLQLGEQSGLILDEAHLSSSNRTAVTFAISGSDAEGTTFRKRSEFV